MKKLLLLSALAIGPVASFAVTWAETEANDTLLTANNFAMSIGDNITGSATGSSTVTAGSNSADFFRVNMAAQAVGIYRNRLTLDNTGHSGALMGRTTSSATSSTTTIGVTSTLTQPSRYVQWYSFGTAHFMDYRVTGTTTTTAAYNSVLSQDMVTASVLAAQTPGMHLFATDVAGTSDTEIFLLDMAGNILQQNDDDASSTTDSSMQYNLVAGQQYILAVGRFNTAGGLQTVLGSGGNDELGSFAAGSYYHSGNLLGSSSNTAGTYDLRIDGTSVDTGAFVANTDHQAVRFYTFRAVPEPTSMVALGLGVAALARRRRSKK